MKRRLDKVSEGRRDGRRAFLSYVDPEIIKSLKVAALQREVPAYEIVEAALQEWLNKNTKEK
jgi:hypothetical protein